MFSLLAQIENPALPTFGSGGSATSGHNLALLIATLWRTLMILGGLAVLIFILWGGVTWITAGGDKAKIEEARNRITGALIGMTLLFATAAIVAFFGAVFGIELLNPSFDNNINSSSNPPGGYGDYSSCIANCGGGTCTQVAPPNGPYACN